MNTESPSTLSLLEAGQLELTRKEIAILDIARRHPVERRKKNAAPFDHLVEMGLLSEEGKMRASGQRVHEFLHTQPTPS